MSQVQTGTVSTKVPARLDRLPWSRWHWICAARYRSAPLLPVMAYSGESTLGAPTARPVATPRTAEDERVIVEESLRDVVRDALGDQAGEVGYRVVAGMAGRALVEAARTARAELVVLSTRGEGGVSRLLGAVSQYVLRHAPCPVLVAGLGHRWMADVRRYRKARLTTRPEPSIRRVSPFCTGDRRYPFHLYRITVARLVVLRGMF
jgi:nucleotide-binding universal stress UspA family protein